MKHLILLSFLVVGCVVWSQSDTSKIEVDPALEIRAAIDGLFIGMKDQDSAMIANLFHEDIRLITSYSTKQGESKIHYENLHEFLTAVGTPHIDVWDERISNVVIQIDDNLAQAWMDFSFYVDEKFSHCGVNAFQFIRMDNEWKIISITDTRRIKGCE